MLGIQFGNETEDSNYLIPIIERLGSHFDTDAEERYLLSILRIRRSSMKTTLGTYLNYLGTYLGSLGTRGET